METLRNLLFYGGVDPEVYRDCREEIWKENREKLFFFLSVSILFLLIALVVCCLVKSLTAGFVIYLVGLAVCLGLICAVQNFPDNHMVTALSADVFMGMLYLMGIYLGTIAYPNEPAICFHVFAVLLPMLFTRPAIWNILRTALYEGIFIGCVFWFKTPDVLALDLLNAFLFGAAACVLSTYYVRALTDNVVARRKLKVIAETDLNTQIPNRNAYENHMQDYPLRCANTLSCVYVDVNGLHELNNTKGHDAGDVMLKTVAQEMVKTFGIKDSYRIGGDEFVAFVVDEDPRMVRERMRALEANVEADGYSVAVGCATCSAGGIQMEALIKQAETRMYDAKNKYYRKRGVLR